MGSQKEPWQDYSWAPRKTLSPSPHLLPAQLSLGWAAACVATRERRTEWENSEEDIRKTSAADQEGIEVSLPFETAKNLDKMHKIQFLTLDFRLHRIVIPERRVRRCPRLPHLAIWRECPGHRAGRGPRQSPAGAKGWESRADTCKAQGTGIWRQTVGEETAKKSSRAEMSADQHECTCVCVPVSGTIDPKWVNCHPQAAERTVPKTHTRSEVVCALTRQSGKLCNSQHCLLRNGAKLALDQGLYWFCLTKHYKQASEGSMFPCNNSPYPNRKAEAKFRTAIRPLAWEQLPSYFSEIIKVWKQ